MVQHLAGCAARDRWRPECTSMSPSNTSTSSVLANKRARLRRLFTGNSIGIQGSSGASSSDHRAMSSAHDLRCLALQWH